MRIVCIKTQYIRQASPVACLANTVEQKSIVSHLPQVKYVNLIYNRKFVRYALAAKAARFKETLKK